MAMQIMWGAIIFFGGWLLSFLFFRQILFNLQTAYPTIKKMKAASPDLIAVGATRYTTISMIVCCFFLLLGCAIVLRFCKALYLPVCFFIGVVMAGIMLIGKMGPENRNMFDTFCSTYYRFVPDDELRTAMFNKKPGQIKQRLYNMGLARDMVPDFKKEDGK